MSSVDSYRSRRFLFGLRSGLWAFFPCQQFLDIRDAVYDRDAYEADDHRHEADQGCDLVDYGLAEK
jgi:hypothetical protein